MAEWFVLDEKGSRKGPFSSKKLRTLLREGSVGLEDYVSVSGSPMFRKAIFEDRLFHVYGVEYGKRQERGYVESEGTRNSFLGLASPEAVGRKNKKKRLRQQDAGKPKDRREKEPRRPKRQELLEVSGLKARQDRKAARRSAKKMMRSIAAGAAVLLLAVGVVVLEQQGFRTQNASEKTATKSAPGVQNKRFKAPTGLTPLRNIKRLSGQTIRVGPLRFKSQGLRSCMSQKNKLAKCELVVRGPKGGTAVLSFFYQAWGKKILKNRENLYVSGLVLSDGKTIVLTELLEG